MKKVLISLITIICVVIGIGVVSVQAVQSGTCGTNVRWVLSDAGTLTISGTGAMTDYINYSSVPWYNSRTNVKNIVVKNGVTSIGGYAFYKCSSLESITIPNSITSIDSWAFYNCSSLKKVYITDLTAWCNIDFKAGNANPLCNEGGLYLDDELITNLIIPDAVTSIGDYAFYTYSSLVSITISDSVTSIGNEAFWKCSSLVSATISDSVTSIGRAAFANCYNLKNITIPNNLTSIGNNAFNDCSSITSITIPDSVTSIGGGAFSGTAYYEDESNWENGVLYIDNCLIDVDNRTGYTIKENTRVIGDYAFADCNILSNVTIPDSVTSIGEAAFTNCSSLKKVYYRGSTDEWNLITISLYNTYLKNSTKVYNAVWVNIKDEGGADLYKGVIDSTQFKLSNGDYDKVGYTTYFFMDAELTKLYESDVVNEDITIYRAYSINQYTYKFVDENGNVLKEATVDYGTRIEAPEAPDKESTAQYTYTFAGWDGYTDGMVVTEDVTFKATYEGILNRCTYTFVDENGNILKQSTVGYGVPVIINPPKEPVYEEPYTFDCWSGFSNLMIITEDVTFVAEKKYMDYTITVDGIYTDGESIEGEDVTVTYGSDYTLPFVNYASYNFLGYYTDVDGSGIKVTDESGNSLEPYSIIGDTIFYPYYEHIYLDEILFFGDETATVGQKGISEAVCFVTKAEATKLYFEVEYPEVLSFVEAVAVDFESVTEESIKTENGITTLVLTAQYADDENIPTNSMVCPFELVFDASTDCELGDIEISISNGTSVIGTGNYGFMTLDKQKITIEPKLAESIYLTGEYEINKPTQFNAEVYPSYTTDKSVTWSVTDETIAMIDEYGVVTPIKTGRAGIKATTSDGSNLYSIMYIDVVKTAAPISVMATSSFVYVAINREVLPEFEDAVVMVATYDSAGCLESVWREDVNADDIVVRIDISISCPKNSKIMLWNSCNSIEPLCEPVEITIGE